jgi:hypothetical protein
MCVIGIRCSTSGETISTGIEIDVSSFDKLPDVLTHTKCPRCGLNHSWWTREAKLFDAVTDRPAPKVV